MNNNRIIKFRAWDKKENRFRFRNECSVNCDGDIFCNDYGGECENNRFIIQQFTGLLDVNGKEIYEGDIIKDVWEENHPYGYNPDEIEEHKEYFAIEYEPPSFTFPIRGDCQSCVENRVLEVVGNIFQPPNLLIV